MPIRLSLIVFIAPQDNILQLESEIKELSADQPPTLVIDLTRGDLVSSLPALDGISHWDTLSIGRVREASKLNLLTSGHMLSHNVEEIRNQLINLDTSHILVLDDTSFTGTTSLLVEGLLKKAFPEREIRFTHGFLIVNGGNLGKKHGARQQLSQNGSQVISGLDMFTPRDDGWHFFDMVDQDSIEDHFQVVSELLGILQQPNCESLASSFLSNEQALAVLFPHLVHADHLLDLEKSGHFLPRRKINGGFHVRNPQLLPSIIGQNHLLPPSEWQAPADEIFALLIQLNHLLQKGQNGTN